MKNIIMLLCLCSFFINGYGQSEKKIEGDFKVYSIVLFEPNIKTATCYYYISFQDSIYKLNLDETNFDCLNINYSTSKYLNAEINNKVKSKINKIKKTNTKHSVNINLNSDNMVVSYNCYTFEGEVLIYECKKNKDLNSLDIITKIINISSSKIINDDADIDDLKFILNECK